MFRQTLTILAVLLTVTAGAQGQQPSPVASSRSLLTLRDVTSGRLRGQSVTAIRPLPGSGDYSAISSDWKKIEAFSFADGSLRSTLFDTDADSRGQFSYVEDYTCSADMKKLLIETSSKQIYRHSRVSTYYIYNIADRSLHPLSDDGQQQAPIFSPDGRYVAFVRSGNIFVTDTEASYAEKQVTDDGAAGSILNGIPDWVNEEEFGTDRQLVFSGDSRYLLWVRYDESLVSSYSLQLFKGLKPANDEFTDYPGFYTYKYPIAGSRNSTVTLWVYDTATGTKRQADIPLDADGYIPRIMTIPGGGLCACTLNRRQDLLRIYSVDGAEGSCRLLIEEHADKYIREETITNMIVTRKHILLPSDRSGWMHLYLYDINGKLLRAVEEGDYEVSDVYGFDEADGSTFYASHERGATEQQVWMVRKNGRKTCLTPAAGWHSAVFSGDMKHFISTGSSLNTPPVTSLCDTKGRTLKILEDNRRLNELLERIALGSRELFQLTTADGILLNGWIVRPAAYDSTRRYPVVMYQYGGPGNQQVRNAWNIGMAGQGAALEQYLCQLGFICVCVDNRGTGGRGADFEKCTYLTLGQKESHDQAEAALWIGRQPWADPSRIAIWGWSFGGFNTLMAMSDGRQVFAAGIAIAPPTSWRYYDTVYTERFMRTPAENPAGYDDCPLSRASNLHGALLLCHGLADDNVHFRNTAEYTEELVQQGKDFRQLVYTNRNHSIYGGNTRHHLFSQCVSFFVEKLKN